jgi:hypothetical protein
MKSLAYHMLDIVQNALRAGATLVETDVVEDEQKELFRLQVADNGRGMDRATLQRAMDPYYTSRKSRHVGLGLSLLKQNSERTGGTFCIDSTPGEGTTVRADFVRSHIDLPAIGDLPGTLHQLIVANPGRDFVYRHAFNSKSFVLDTREIKQALEGWPIDHPGLRNDLRELIESYFQELNPGSGTSVIEHA